MGTNEKELSVFIGHKIKHFRNLKNLKQKDLAAKIKKSANTVSDYERGIIAPSQDALFALAAALDVKVDDFFPQEKNENNGYLQQSLSSSDIKKSTEEMIFMNNLLNYLQTLESEEKSNLMSNIEMAIALSRQKKK